MYFLVTASYVSHQVTTVLETDEKKLHYLLQFAGIQVATAEATVKVTSH